MKYWLYIILMFVAPEIFADIFDADIPPNDLSREYLGYIFGQNIGNISLGGVAKPAISSIMEKFNFFIVIVGTIMMIYIGLMSTFNTGQEGDAMGKKWSSTWLPLRSVIGMVLMVPSPTSGYSVIQVLVIWIVLQGVGIADTCWKIVLDGLKSGAGLTGVVATKAQLPSPSDAFELAHAVLDAAICMRTFREAAQSKENVDGNTWVHKNGGSVRNFFSNETTQVIPSINDPNPTSASVSGTSYFGINNPLEPKYQSLCGKINITGTVSASEYKYPPDSATMLADALKIYSAKRDSISMLLDIFKPLVEGLVVRNGSKTADFSQPEVGATQYYPGLKQLAIDTYTTQMSGLIVPSSADASDQQSAVDDAVAQGLDKGWIVAGSFYFILNQTLNSKVFLDAKTKLDIDATNPRCRYTIAAQADSCQKLAYAAGGDPFDPDEARASSAIGKALSDLDIKSPIDRANLALYLAEGSVYLNFDTGTNSTTALNFPTGTTDGGGDIMSAALAPLSQAGTGAVNAMISIMDHHDMDPLLAHSMLGRDIMFACEMAWITIFAISFGISLGVGYWGILIGLPMWLLGLLATVSAVLGTLWALGASLAIYTPLIPYMFFTTAAIGWALIVIEAVIAGPIIALGLVVPGGDEMGKIQHAFGLISNLFFRPMLMIFGFAVAGSVYKAALTLVNSGMASVFQTISVNTLFSSVVIMALYVSFVLGITNLCFSLIYAVPDKVLRWIGGTAESTGQAVKQAVGQTKESTEGVAHTAGSQLGEGVQAVGNKLMEATREQLKSNITQDKANKIAAEMKDKFNAGNTERNAANNLASKMKGKGENAGTVAGTLLRQDKLEKPEIINALLKGGFKEGDIRHPAFSADDFAQAKVMKAANTNEGLAKSITERLTAEGMSRPETIRALLSVQTHANDIKSAGFKPEEIASVQKADASRLGRAGKTFGHM